LGRKSLLFGDILEKSKIGGSFMDVKQMNQSKGEQRVAQILEAARIAYVTEKTFHDLKQGKYRFDFYLPKENICIEFDGAQHFEFVRKFHRTRADFTKQQGHDRQKNSYCLAHNIPLYRIPYWDMDKLNIISDLFCERYLVKSRWHNDEIWRVHKNK
jgi:hypothetical protein